ncbi:MAG: hypothetical protein IT236_10760, partial [Bacteroidia bacterium]|nr:hypothetical protein [Bacteroidia bacterium]
MKKFYFSLLILLVGLLPQLSQAQSELWGVTTAGGNGFGSLYSMPTGSTGIAFQRNFAGASGSSPQQTRMIQASNGKLYGVLFSGGFNNLGVLFEYDITTNTYTKRYDFNTANGSSPRAGLMQASDGKLYGTTSAGGANGVGALFQFDISTNTYTKKYDFVVANGSQPFGGLVEPTTPNGKLYGMTRTGGTNSVGTIYEYDLATFAYTKKIDLNSTSGTLPFGELTASGSLFYGLTSAGGTSSVGTLVEYDYGTNTLTKKYDFVAANGSSPQGTLFKASNNVLYGATAAGGTNSVGVIFQYSVSTAAYTKLADFVSANGCEGRGTLVQAANGKLYGLNRIGGANNNGAIYEYSISTSSYTKLFDLQNSVAIGGGPLGSLTYASNGKLYGLTTNGGIAGGGVIFEYDISTSTYTKKVDLNLAVAGGAANGGPVYAANGKIYGTAITGGTNNIGALYEYDRLTSTFTKKYDFITGSGSSPYGSMIEASNNKLYGMTNVGGVSGLGTIYEYNYTSNVYTKKIDLSATLGSLPFGNMVQAANGKLYGLTRSGGTSGLGVLFEYDYTTNVYTKKADLTTSTGSQPSGSLIEAPNGKLYGLTQLGGINNVGALIEYDYATNTLTKKIDLSLANGSQPLGSLVLGPDGMLYGVTQLGGTNNLGALFQYDYTTNTYTKKVDLSATTGSTPKGSLIKANSGILYGVTTAAGTNSLGTHFSYNVTSNTFTKLLDFSQTTGCTPGYTSLLEVCPKPENAGSIFSTGTSLCSGNSSSQTFSIAVLPSALSYTWSLPAGASITSGTLTNVITANLSGISPGAFTFSVGGVNTCGTGSLSTLAYSINSSPTVVVSNGTLCAGSAYTITPTGASTYTYSGGSNVVSPSITTNYTVTGTSAQGCISSSAAVLTVSVGALPVVTANSSTNAVCIGATVSLSGGGASSYTWSGGVTNGFAFTPTITTNYTVTGMDGNGCQNTAIKTVTVFALPTVSTVASSTAICSGGTVSVSGSGASTYTWTGGVSNGVAFTPTLTNTYSVTGTDVNGCQNTASRAIVVNARPVVTANTSTSAVCIGGLVTLTGGGASTYTWTGGATNNVAFAPSTTISYSVSGTSTAGCTSTNVANVT